MRILVSNPDTIGDFVLRQPMFAALQEAGHELMLVVRSFVSPLTPMVAPGAKVIQCELNPYEPAYSAETPAFQSILTQAREFSPDLMVVAPYQRTELEEDLAQRLAGVPTAGMSGYLFPGSLYFGQNKQSRLSLTTEVSVPVDAHELRKSELLCSAILRRNVVLPPPCLRPPAELLRTAQSRLAALGLQKKTFWIACVGDNPYTQIKNWRRDRWAETLAETVRRHDIRLLFIGTPDENETTEAVRAAMGGEASRTVSMCATPDGMDTLVGLIHESAAYLGKDTGPMHIAAALQKPVIAVFGGGGWPRFTPVARVGAVFTVQVPCAGCNYICHLEQSHCVKQVPLEPVLEAVDAVAASRMERLSIQALQPDDMLVARMIREASEVSQKRLREGNRLARELETELQQIRGAEPLLGAEKQQIADLQAAKEWLEARKVELELAQQQYLREIAALNAAKSETEKVNSHQAADLAAGRSEFGQIQQQMGRFQARTEELERERAQWRERAELSERGRLADHERAQEQVRQLTETHERERRAFVARETALSAELSQWRAQAERSSEQAAHLAEQRSRLEEEVSRRDAAAAILESNHLEFVNNLKMLMTDLKDQLGRKDRQIESMTDLVRSLKKELDQRVQQEAVLRNLESDRTAAMEHLRVLQARLQEAEDDRAARLTAIHRLEASLLESETDRAARLLMIRDLESRIHEAETDRAARLAVIQELEAKLTTAETDRAARLAAIRKLESDLKIAEADRAARLVVIQELESRIEESTTAGAAWQVKIRELETRLKTSEDDRAARLAIIEQATRQLTESEADRAARLENMKRLENILRESDKLSTARMEAILTLEDRLKVLESRLVYRAAHAVGLL